MNIRHTRYFAPAALLMAALPTTTLPVRAQTATTKAANARLNAAAPGFALCSRTRTTFGGRLAFRLSDGKTSAIIVPAIGRVMFYGFVGGDNQLWNAPPEGLRAGDWKNYGGEKTWAAPQDWWPVLAGTARWPPDKSWDGAPHAFELLTGGALRTLSPVSPFSGARCVREFGFNRAGEFVISQIFEKRRGEPVIMSIWSVAQVPHPDTIFVRRDPASAYSNGVYPFGRPAPTFEGAPLPNGLLRLRPSAQNSFKLGLDTPVAGIVAVREGVAFTLRASKPRGTYPDGASDGGGFPVEIFNNPRPAYDELELLGPLQTYQVGGRFRHSVRWSLHQLPTRDAAAPEVADFAAAMLQ